MINTIIVPTGHICVMDGDRGKIEFLSIGDYGKERNVKADFLGLTTDIDGVDDGNIMPLSEKWVTTISTQYGCSMNCSFCDVPKVGPGINATLNDLTNQVIGSLSIHPEISYTKRFNLHYARMGEPTFNRNVLFHATGLKNEVKPYIGNSLVHPVVSTMMPKRNGNLVNFLNQWCFIKNKIFNGCAGLQLSINSTSDDQRVEMFSGNAMSLKDISEIGKQIPDPIGRKYALNFSIADHYELDAKKLCSLFSPDKFMVKITPLHLTKSCIKNNIKTTGGYSYFTPYKAAESDLKKAGFDVLIFVPSVEEDNSRITCGNAILSDIPKDGE